MSTKSTKNFFKNQREDSRIKMRIVTNYFAAWANIVGSSPPNRPLAYLDLFAGPGSYDDGNLSTSVLITRVQRQRRRGGRVG